MPSSDASAAASMSLGVVSACSAAFARTGFGAMFVNAIAALSIVPFDRRTMAVTPTVDATLEPAQIALGESAQLTITTSGKGTDFPKLPQVAGLELHIVGQSQRIQIINGATLASTSMIVSVTPQTAGIFTIPGVAPNSQPLVLRVNPPGSPVSPVVVT